MSARPPLARGFISELDGLRGVAILLVMVHRFWPRTGVGVAADAAGAGWIGVDLFFVISGFLITGILLDTSGDRGYFRNFYARRVLRIFPLYYLFVIGVLIAFSGNPAFREHAGSPLWYLFHLGNVPEGLLDHDVPYWLAPVWSLAIEEQFYLTFPLLVWLVGRRWLGHVLVGMILAAPLIRLGTMLAVPEQERIQYLFTLCRIDTIAIGCLLAVIARRVDVLRWRATATRVLGGVVSGAAAIALVTGLDRTTSFGRVVGYSAVAFGCAGVVGLVVLWRGAAATQVLRMPSLQYLGKLCFGLYLLHRPADTIVSSVADRIGLDADLRILPFKIVVAVGLATASWWLLEKRVLRLKERFSSDRHPASASAGAPGRGARLSGVLQVTLLIALTLALAASGCRQPGAAGDRDDAADHAAWPDTAADPGSDGAPHDGRVVDAAGDAHPDAPPDALIVDPATVLYPEHRRHSPLPPQLVARLQAIAALEPHAEHVFAKLGDSITRAEEFLHCFDGGAVDLGGHAGLGATIAHYLQGNAAGSTPFTRWSFAAIGGTTAADALAGSPCSVDRELDVADPRLAVIMFGTNDARYGRSLDAFAVDLWTMADKVIARGTIPILSTIPANNGDPWADARIPAFNLAIRAIAQGRGIPLVDLHRELAPLPARGLSADGVHPSVAPGGGCILTTAGLAYGYDVRNLLTLEALERARQALGGVAAEASAVARAGTGRASDPFVAALPLVDLGDSRTGAAALGSYGCGGPSQPGRELVYRLDLPSAVTLDAHVIDRGGVDVDVHVVAGGLGSGTCVASGDHVVTATLGPGLAHVIVDGPSLVTDGEFLLIVAAR